MALWAVLGMTASGCDSQPSVSLTIRDACNQDVIARSDHLELRISGPDRRLAGAVIWSTGSHEGDLPEVPELSEALISVIARQGDPRAGSSRAVGAMGVGFVNLTTANSDGSSSDSQRKVPVVLGLLDTFMRASDASVKPATCEDTLVERRGHTATRLDDGSVLIAGGDRPEADGKVMFWQTTEIYEPKTSTFVEGPTLRFGRRDHTATLLTDGRVLLAGGVGTTGTGVETWKSAVIYDPSTRGFETVLHMIEPRSGHSATLLGDGTVLVTGGFNNGRALDTIEILDPVNLTSRVLVDASLKPVTLATGRAYHGAVSLGAFLVAVVGGRVAAAGSIASTGSVEFVFVHDGLVTAGPTLSTPRSHAAVMKVPGQSAVLVAGGVAFRDDDGFDHGTDAMEIIKLDQQAYELSTVTCNSVGLSTARGAPCAATVPDGVLIAGGITETGDVTDTADVVAVRDVESCAIDVLPTSGKLSRGRAGAATSVLLDGDVLVTGGFGRLPARPVAVGEAEIYVRMR